MSNFRNTGSQIFNQAIDETSTTQKVTLGTRVQAKDVASTAYGDQNAKTTSALDTPSTGLVEVSLQYPIVNNALAD